MTRTVIGIISGMQYDKRKIRDKVLIVMGLTCTMSQMYNVLNVKCPKCTMSQMYNVLNVKYPKHIMSQMYNVSNVQCPNCTIF